MMDNFLKKANPTYRPAFLRKPSLKEKPARLEEEPAKKKIKREEAYKSDADSDDYQIDTPPLKPRPNLKRDDTSDSHADDDTAEKSETEDTQLSRPTAIESSLPEIKPDKQAIEEYQNFKASQGDDTGTASSRLDSRKWVRGKSSLYVDAFNLALDTVLEEESHLFDEKEQHIFKEWRSLSYEAQFLYASARILVFLHSDPSLDMSAYSLGKLLRGIASLAWVTMMISQTLKPP
jgi:Fanconi-associated nuclease 1